MAELDVHAEVRRRVQVADAVGLARRGLARRAEVAARTALAVEDVGDEVLVERADLLGVVRGVVGRVVVEGVEVREQRGRAGPGQVEGRVLRVHVAPRGHAGRGLLAHRRRFAVALGDRAGRDAVDANGLDLVPVAAQRGLEAPQHEEVVDLPVALVAAEARVRAVRSTAATTGVGVGHVEARRGRDARAGAHGRRQRLLLLHQHAELGRAEQQRDQEDGADRELDRGSTALGQTSAERATRATRPAAAGRPQTAGPAGGTRRPTGRESSCIRRSSATTLRDLRPNSGDPVTFWGTSPTRPVVAAVR